VRATLAAAIDAARDLAWRPMANVSGIRLQERHEAHERLVDALTGVRRLPPGATPELRYLVRSMRRAARASYSNRRYAPYYERRQAVAELRGCLSRYDDEVRIRGLEREQARAVA
jgi:hypothetical protein